MNEQQFLWNSLDGGENVFIKERGSDKTIHIKIIEGKYEFVDFMKKVNEQQATINLLLNLLYQSEETVINEYSSHIGEDMDKLDKIFKEKDIKEIERFVRGCDDE